MKEELDEQSRKDLIKYRIDRAYETMKEADILACEMCYNAAINRLYYACYYATVALLLKHNISTSTHAGVKTMLGLHFVSKGLLDKEYGRTFQALFDSRHSSDYEDFVYCDEEMVKRFTPKAQAYIDTIAEML